MTPVNPKKSINIETTRKTSPNITFGPIGTSFDDFEKYDFLYIFPIEADTHRFSENFQSSFALLKI
jgi:hypothetical protein